MVRALVSPVVYPLWNADPFNNGAPLQCSVDWYGKAHRHPRNVASGTLERATLQT
jgi:hypothetical protein